MGGKVYIKKNTLVHIVCASTYLRACVQIISVNPERTTHEGRTKVVVIGAIVFVKIIKYNLLYTTRLKHVILLQKIFDIYYFF